MSWLTSGSRRAEVALIFRTNRRGRAAGVGAVFAAFGLAMVSPPTARADDFGLGDPISDLLSSSNCGRGRPQGGRGGARRQRVGGRNINSDRAFPAIHLRAAARRRGEL